MTTILKQITELIIFSTILWEVPFFQISLPIPTISLCLSFLAFLWQFYLTTINPSKYTVTYKQLLQKIPAYIYPSTAIMVFSISFFIEYLDGAYPPNADSMGIPIFGLAIFITWLTPFYLVFLIVLETYSLSVVFLQQTWFMVLSNVFLLGVAVLGLINKHFELALFAIYSWFIFYFYFQPIKAKLTK